EEGRERVIESRREREEGSERVRVGEREREREPTSSAWRIYWTLIPSVTAGGERGEGHMQACPCPYHPYQKSQTLCDTLCVCGSMEAFNPPSEQACSSLYAR